MANQPGSRIAKIPKRFVGIIAEAAKETYLGSDYTSNISQLVTDSKLVLNQLNNGKSKVADIVSDIKQNGGKKIADWFFDGDMATGEYDLMANNDSDFDAGYQLGDGESEEDTPAPSKILDYDSMKDVARGQVNAMYKIAGKQAEASMLNAAEITSTINGRAAELVTAVNNVNSSVMAISEKLDTLIKLQSTAIEQAEEEANREAYGIVGSDGRATLGTFTKYIQSSTSNLFGSSNPLMMMAQEFLTPKGLVSLGLDALNLQNKDIGKALNKIDFLKDRQFVKDLQGQTWDSLGKNINEAVGNSVHDVLTGQFNEGNISKKIDKLLSQIPMGDIVKNGVLSSMGLKGDDIDNYKSSYKSTYNTDASKFDGKVYTTIVDIIPEYLKIITKSLTGKDFRIRQSGDAAGTLTDEKYNARKSTDYSSVRGNTIASNMGQSFMDSVEQGVQELFTGNTGALFNQHKDDIYELFTLEAVSFFVMNGYKVTGIKDLTGDDFWNYIENQMINDYREAIPGLKNFDQSVMKKFINSIKSNIIKARSSDVMSASSRSIHRLAQDITRRVAEFKTANTARTKDQVLNRVEATNISHDELIENFKQGGQLRSYENKYQEASNRLYEEIERKLSEAGGDHMNRILREDKRNSIARQLADDDRFSKVKIDNSEIKLEDLKKKIEQMSSYGDSSDLKDLTSQVSGISGLFTSNIESFRDGVFTRLDKIISLIPRRGSTIPAPPSGAGGVTGSGDDREDPSDDVSKADEMIIASSNAMVQAAAADGELSSDLPIIKRMLGNVKNRNLSGKLFNMWTTVGNNLKSKVATVKENGIGATLKNFFSGGLIGILTKGVKIIVSTIGTLFLNLIARPFLKIMKKGIDSGVGDIKSGFEGLKENLAEAKAKREEKKAEKEEQRQLREQNQPLNQSSSDVADSVGLSGMDGSPVQLPSSSGGSTAPAGSGVGSSGSTGGGSTGGGTGGAAGSGGTGGTRTGIGGKISGAFGKVGSALGKVGKGISGFISKITTAFSDMLAKHPMLKILIGVFKIVGTLVAGMAAVKAFMKKLQDTITKGLKPLTKGVEAIIKTLDPIIKKIGKVVEKLATGISKMLKMLTGIFKVISDVVGTVLESIFKLLDPLLAAISAILSVVVKVLEPILELLDAVLTPVLDMVVNLLDSILTIVDALSPLFDIITESVQALSTLLDPFIGFMTDIMLKQLEPICWLISNVIAPAIQIIAGTIQIIYGGIHYLLGDLIRNVGFIVGILSDRFNNQEMYEQSLKVVAAGTDMTIAGSRDVNAGLDSIAHAFDGKGKVSAEEASSSTSSSSIPSASAANGAAVDTYGSGPDEVEDPTPMMLSGIANMVQRIMRNSDETTPIISATTEDVLVPIHNKLFEFNDDYKHYKLKIDAKTNSVLKNTISPRLVDLVSNSKLMIGTMQNDDAQLLSAMGLLLAAQGQGDAGSALFNTAAGMAASGLIMANTGVVGSVNNFNKMAGLDPMSLSKLYDDVDPNSVTSEDESETENAEATALNLGQNTETEDTPSEITEPELPEPEETTDDSGHRHYFQITGSGNSQSSYGSYMNMTKRGCGPVALADAFSRRGGGNVDAGSLAQGMAASGNYSTSKGTSIGGFLNTAKSMGMGYTVGGVSQGSLKRATPDNPVTIVGSGNGFGTRSGNNHYVNVVGTDSNGGAYVSNPISGRVERHSTNDVLAGSIVGLYGSGPTPDELYKASQTLTKSYKKDDADVPDAEKYNKNGVKLKDVKILIAQLKSKYPKLYEELVKAYNIECKNGNHSSFENWLRGKIPNNVKPENLSHITNLLQQMASGIIVNDGGTANPEVSEEIDEGEGIDMSGSTSSITTGSLNGSAAIENNYVNNTQRRDATQAYIDAITGKTKIDDSSTTGSSFSSVFKNAMSGLTGIFNNILGLFTISEDDELEAAEEEDKQKALEEELRATLGNDEYEAYQNAGFILYQRANPRGKNETIEQYKKRLTEAWKDEATRRKWTNMAARENASYINAAKLNDTFDAANQADTTIWGEYDPETGQWTGGLMNGGGSTATGGSGIGGSVSGGTTEQQVWMYLTKVLGFTPQGAAGVLGNMQAESGLKPNNLEDIFNDKLGMTDEEYTSAVDDNSYSKDKFTSDHNRSGLGAGYGLVQFTAAELKSALYDIAKNKGVSISDVGAQMDAVAETVDSDVISKLKSTTDINEASDIWLKQYERPANIEGQVPIRRANAQKFYDALSTWNGDGVTVTSGTTGGIISGTSYGPTLNKINMNDALRSAAGSTWEAYKDKEGIAGFFQQAANSSMTPQQQALTMAMGIWEDGAKKLIGEKSLTKVTVDKNGQRAVGLMNWIPESSGDNDTSYGSTLAEQLSYIQQSYFSDNPEHSRGRVNSGNLNSYQSALETLTGHSLIGKANDPIGPIINQDLVEGSGHYVGGALVPEGWSTVSGLGKYVGLAADVYNWMIDNGYTSGGAGGGSIGGTGTVVGKYNTAYNTHPETMGLSGAAKRGSFFNYAASSVNGRNNRVYSNGMGSGGNMVGGNGAFINALIGSIIETDKAGYHTYGHGELRVNYGGKELVSRPDCSGMVQLPLQYLGYDTSDMPSCSHFVGVNDKTHHPLTKDGVEASEITSYKWGENGIGPETVQPGDILLNNDHTEVGIGVKDGRLWGWNFGSTDAIKGTQAMAKAQASGKNLLDAAVENSAYSFGSVDGMDGHYNYLIRVGGGNGMNANSTINTNANTNTNKTTNANNVSAVTGSGDIPPIDFDKILGTDSENVTTNNIVVQKADVSNEKMMEDLQNMTFNVRAQKVEELLEEISKKMDDIKKGRDKGDSPKPSDKQSNVNPFDDSIPSQIQRLSIG